MATKLHGTKNIQEAQVLHPPCTHTHSLVTFYEGVSNPFSQQRERKTQNTKKGRILRRTFKRKYKTNNPTYISHGTVTRELRDVGIYTRIYYEHCPHIEPMHSHDMHHISNAYTLSTSCIRCAHIQYHLIHFSNTPA